MPEKGNPFATSLISRVNKLTKPKNHQLLPLAKSINPCLVIIHVGRQGEGLAALPQPDGIVSHAATP
jgi:hypothetical protein